MLLLCLLPSAYRLLLENTEVLVASSHRSGGLHYGSSRSPRNASRYLILGLSALVGIGAFFYLKNLKSSRGDDARETVAPAAGNEAARVAAARDVRPPSGALLAPGNPATKPVALVTPPVV